VRGRAAGKSGEREFERGRPKRIVTEAEGGEDEKKGSKQEKGEFWEKNNLSKVKKQTEELK